MKVGEYVRTKDGFIGKITSIENNERVHLFQKSIYTDNYKWLDLALEESIIKSSPKIINLIQVEDYVNGRKVYQVGYNFQDDLVLKMSINADGTPNNFEDFIYEKDIKSIVTKEQFKSMEYKVGSNNEI